MRSLTEKAREVYERLDERSPGNLGFLDAARLGAYPVFSSSENA